MERRPGAGLSLEGGDPGRSRDGGRRPGDGLRKPGPGFRDRRAVHAQPGNRRARALRRRHVRRAGRGRRRRDARNRTDLGARRAHARRRRRAARRTPTGSSATTPTCATSSSRSRTAACGCSRCASASAARRPRCGSRSTWRRTRSFPLSRADAVERVLPLLADPPVRATSRSSILRPLVTGLPASPGTASGEIATTPEAAVEAAEAGRPVILVRSETSPNDVHGMARAAGILTATGGLASHAAVVARGWGIPAVVGASAVQVGDRWVALGDRRFRAGDTITIDGGSGEVFEGAIPGTTEPVPEAATLLGWARDARDHGRRRARVRTLARRPRAGRASTRVIRALGIKGFAMTQGVADAVLSSPEHVQPLLDDLRGRRARGVGCRGIPAHRQRQGPRRRARRGGSREHGAPSARMPRSMRSSRSISG